MKRVPLLLAWFVTGCSPVLQYRGSAPMLIDVSSGSEERTLIVAQDVLDGWSFLYQHIDDTEFALCLEGRAEKQRIVVTGFRLAHITVSAPNGVAYSPCTGPAYIGTAHNHPPTEDGKDGCHQSAQDQRSFRQDRRAALDVVICGRNRFVWVARGAAPRVWAGR